MRRGAKLLKICPSGRLSGYPHRLRRSPLIREESEFVRDTQLIAFAYELVHNFAHERPFRDTDLCKGYVTSLADSRDSLEYHPQPFPRARMRHVGVSAPRAGNQKGHPYCHARLPMFSISPNLCVGLNKGPYRSRDTLAALIRTNESCPRASLQAGRFAWDQLTM